MRKSSMALACAMALATGGAAVASWAGWLAPRPAKEPISVREGSAKLTSGHRGTRYFVGGGLHGGK